jgi:hypothetical protein
MMKPRHKEGGMVRMPRMRARSVKVIQRVDLLVFNRRKDIASLESQADASN